MATPFSLLSCLPIDLIKVLLPFLEIQHVRSLWLSGNRRTQYQLQAAVTHLKVSAAMPLFSWPHFVSNLKLSELLFSENSHCGKYYFVQGVNLATLPQALKKLQLGFPNAFSALVSLLEYDNLSSHLPLLTDLEFGTKQHMPTFQRSRFLQALPKTLERLLLPKNIPFPPSGATKLPPNLTDLRIALADLFYDQPQEEEEEYSEIIFPPYLTTLSLFVLHNPSIIKNIPKTVTDLVLDFETVSHRGDLEHEVAPINVDALTCLTMENFRSLPPLLTRLDLHFARRFGAKELACLPRTLKRLCLAEGGGFIADSPESLAAVLKALPPHLVELFATVTTADINSAYLVSLFPQTLRNWTGVKMSPKLWTNGDEFQFPPCLENLRIETLSDDILESLPAHITSLSFDNYALHKKKSLQLLKKQHWKILNAKAAPAACIPHLPGSLTKITVKIDDFEAPPALFRSWPAKLIELRLHLYHVFSDFWNSLPPGLEDLSVTAYNYIYLPKTMECLPRNLMTVSMTCLGLELDPPAEIEANQTLYDGHLQHLPPNMRSLTVTGMPSKISCEGMAALPRSLTYFSATFNPIVREETWPPPLFASPEPLPASANSSPIPSSPPSPSPPDFLESLPRFCELGTSTGQKQRSLLQQRLSNDCPNVDFWWVKSARQRAPLVSPSVRKTKSCAIM